MSIDGSFNLSSSLRRFLSRVPKLATSSRFSSLVNKGDTLTEEELVKVLADVFLHPSLTIPLIGCFRPIVRKIVDKVVFLLTLVASLKSDSEDLDEESVLDAAVAEGVGVIDFYVRKGKGLKLHEHACLAFCRTLDLAPFLLGSILCYFEFAPPPFERILSKKKVSKITPKVATLCLSAVRASYRLLKMEPEVFSKLWDWSCFLDFVSEPVEISDGHNTQSVEFIADIRWCGVQIVSVILKSNGRPSVGADAEEATLCLLRWQEFCQDVAIEKAGSYIGLSNVTKSETNDGCLEFNNLNCLQSFGLNYNPPSHFHDFEPLTKCRKLATRDYRSGADPFILTSGVRKSFEMTLLAVSQKWPILLYGLAGSGKSALVRKLAQDSGNHVLSIHMDDQIDGKTLVGSYVCADQPGEFKWQPGSLTQALLNGFWVVFEDIDKAPSDVSTILLPLLEGASSILTSHGEVIRVAESFRLFSTISTSNCGTGGIPEGGNVLGGLWRKIMVSPPNNDDMQNIVKVWHPNLAPVSKKLIETFESINCPPLRQSGTSTSISYTDSFSLRDLLKWCKRIDGSFSSDYRAIDGVSSYDHRSIYQEAVDIFASLSMSTENRSTIKKDIARKWDVPDLEAVDIHSYKPTIQDFYEGLQIGRAALRCSRNAPYDRSGFVEIRSSLCVLEKIARSVEYNEPVLLVGETGTGKTTLVQNLAKWLGQKLTVLNLSQQSDVADLLGGFKPMDARFMCISLYNEFEDLAVKTFGWKDDNSALTWLRIRLSGKKWMKLLSGMTKTVEYLNNKLKEKEKSGRSRKRKSILDDEEKFRLLGKFDKKVKNVHQQISSAGMIFTFVEGAFITALRNGEWILLDEVNLASPETLGRIVGVLEGGSICLAERGDASDICRHPDFRLFACMNPATDAGKRDLPYSLRSRFTEYFVDDVLDDRDLVLFVMNFLEGRKSDTELVKKIVCFYKEAKKESAERLQDGANQSPQYSLRSLYRALEYIRKAERSFGFQKAIYDGFCMFFLSLLDRPSANIMNQMIKKHLVGKDEPLPRLLPFTSYLADADLDSDNFMKSYILTKTVKEHLGNLARAIFIKRYPVLLQGPTSSGKTSLVQYLAAITGHKFVRINNHEQTDLQEYLGSYITDSSGKLVFHEGVLVKAVRNGHWVVLDELNLAPSDVLEALNRLLDDNRELFVPELRETVRAHPNFMLFATQNPPTLYGGRKLLSRAFRNRFVEIHVGEIAEDELSTILHHKCKIPLSYANKMVEVMKELQLHRQSSKVFAGKHGYITPRDLFRWADRFKEFGKSYDDLARDGYYILAERLRDENEKCVVQKVLEKHLRVELFREDFYKQDLLKVDTVCWTKSMWRLYFLVKRCYELREPVLLVGETGGGKTTVCQLLSKALGLRLHILNCHQYTETSDFLGGFYPIRDRSKLSTDYMYLIQQLKQSKAWIYFGQDAVVSEDISEAASTAKELCKISDRCEQGPDVTTQDIELFKQMKLDLIQLHQKWQAIFMWQDGSLVQAMRSGDLFLLDEISLADDSVLERLNSVLEPERKLSLAEKGGSVLEEVTASTNFFVLATMNPGGDYGKKELSPALRNRFTEIWVPAVTDLDELRSIALQGLSDSKLSYVVEPIIIFLEWFNQLQMGRKLTVRDLLSWIVFINVTKEHLGAEGAMLHGAFLVLLDGLSLGTGISRMEGEELRKTCFSFLLEHLKVDADKSSSNFLAIENYGWGNIQTAVVGRCCITDSKMFGIDPFYIEKGLENCEVGGFEFLAPTTCRNALRVLRAMQLLKPVLLEGSPGVGKTSLIVALGKYSGHKVVRINLSEQTDIMDLLGSDLPVDSDGEMKFAWSDGILLQALKQGCWVLLDELNLAPQSVLEGLNAILDHRASVFIPELGHTFECPPSFRVFACQNPSSQGGGRKGLPKSFLNRFTKVYVDELVEDDYLFICRSLYPSIAKPVLSNLISFNRRLHEETMLHHKFGQNGSPWEFNLRDVVRSCQMIQGTPQSETDSFLNVLYVQRMRTATDRREVLNIFEQIFGKKPSVNHYPRVQLSHNFLTIGNAVIKRNHTYSYKNSSSQLKIIPEIRQNLEAAAHCIQNQWLCILVGPSSSGKTSLIRILSQLTGNTLNEINLSSASDISELLGCFEQYNVFRSFRLAVSQVERFFNEYSNLQSEASLEALSSEQKDLISKWLTFCSRLDSGFMSCSPSSYVQDIESVNDSSFNDSVSKLLEIVKLLKQEWGKNILRASWSSKDLDSALEKIVKLQRHRRRPSAKFEWVTGLLIKAIENGEWVVLENANLCNPTVLDRINSLVESCGTITINECGIIDGKPVVVDPHPNFRMFLTVDPTFGEVSRAMRNRGVEIYMMEPYWLLDEKLGLNCDELKRRDVIRFLTESGIPGGALVNSMAKAHLYAWNKGLNKKVHITYLELAHWVQLFQQLLLNGNQPLWSLQVSWEHTYLSSFGVADGREIISHAHGAYLSRLELSEYDSQFADALYLPGGWPMPLSLIDYTWFPKESSVRQNFMYLEFLGSQYASYQFDTCCQDLNGRYARTYIINSEILRTTMYPEVSNKTILNSNQKTDFNIDLAGRMLWFAANWTIEQAMEKTDFQVYLFWFRWLDSRLQPYCNFFNSYHTTLEKELKHPIWQLIFNCRQDLISFHNLDLNLHPSPVLSLELVNSTASNDKVKMSSQCLSESISCVSLLRLSYQQWHTEDRHNYSDEARCYIPFLKSLRALEEGVLGMLVGSPFFDVLIQLYTNLFEDHLQFWSGVTSSEFEEHLQFWRGVSSSKFEPLLVSFRSLVKTAKRLQKFLSREVEVFLMASKNLGSISLHSERSLLWVYGGHPCVPVSSRLYNQQQKLLKICDSVWPIKSKSWKEVNGCHIEVVSALNSELRSHALQGISMSSCIMGKNDGDNERDFQHVEEINQMLLRRLEYEKNKLTDRLASDEHAITKANSSSCCVFHPETLCVESGFNSWLETLPLIDGACCSINVELLDLLQELLLIQVIEPTQLEPAFQIITSALGSALKYLLSSARPPQTIVPHQKILWTIDAWTSVDEVNKKLSGSVLEMWYWWHSSLWINSVVSSMVYKTIRTQDSSKINGYDIQLPMLIQPVKTATVVQMLQSPVTVKDYYMQSLKLKASSCKLWNIPPPKAEMPTFLFSIARSLFQQIIYTHKKSFSADKFTSIKSLLYSTQKKTNTMDPIVLLISLIGSSSHEKLKSLLPSFVKPLLELLYLDGSPADSYSSLGAVWLYLGGLRLHLLVSCDDLDPAMKYSCKLSQLQERIALLELNMKVRQECEHLAGCFSSQEGDRRMMQSMQKLEIDSKNLQSKIVFRPDPTKFRALRKECKEFLGYISSSIGLVKNIGILDLQHVVDQAYNWQETAMSFIERLTNEYAEYADIVQPVQVAVYEMKLGLSLVLSDSLLKKSFNTIKEDKVDLVMESIYSFMRFPRRYPIESAINCTSWPLVNLSRDTDSHTKSLELDASLLDKLLAVLTERDAETVPLLQFKATLQKNHLVRVAHYVGHAKLMDNASFELLDRIFLEFAKIWVRMKDQVKAREDSDAQQYKFRARAFKIETVIEVDILALRKYFSNDSYMEWKDFLTEKESNEMMEIDQENENLEDEWNLVQESLNDIISVHNQLFGSFDLVLNPGSFQISDAVRLDSFVDSYTFGVRIIQGLGSILTSLDAKLVPEHLLRLCLEHKKKFVPAARSAGRFNFYKDSNAPLLAKMGKLLIVLQQRICALLREWEDYSGLQRLLEVIQMLLDIPSDTPLAKVLSGLQFLLSRIRQLQEEGCKFSVSDQLEPVASMVGMWQKMEFESWPALLDEVQDQYEVNAAKLWFPLFSVLDPEHSADVAEYTLSVTESLEEFIQTSSVGEFRKRLQLLYAFLGQLSTGISLEVYSSDWHKTSQSICYNVFGFYVQFLPIVMEQIHSCRSTVEDELKQLLKLCRWDRLDSYVSFDNTRKMRQKLKKIIQKYTDMLQQPVMLILSQDAPRKGVEICTSQGPKLPSSISDKSVATLTAVLETKQYNDEERFLWYDCWRKQLNRIVETYDLTGLPRINFPNFENIRDSVRQCFTCPSACPVVYQEEWKNVWNTLEEICGTAIGCGDLWKDENRSLGKKRALSGLLKLLETSGLSRHKFVNMEISNHSNWLQPPHDMQHLLLPVSKSILHFSTTTNLECHENKDSDAQWKAVNELYFQSLASVQLLRQVCWKHHEDFTGDQVNRSVSFLNHLISIQQMQRASSYGFSKEMSRLRDYVSVLENILLTSTNNDVDAGVACSFAQNQRATLRLMWQQKQMFDGLTSILLEQTLLLRIVESTHLHSCENLKAAANSVLSFIGHLVPDLQKSKDSLDNCLLSCEGAITIKGSYAHPYFITKQTEELLLSNLEVLKEFEEQLIAFCKGDLEKSSVMDVLLSHFGDFFEKRKLMTAQLSAGTEARDQLSSSDRDETAFLESLSKINFKFTGTLRRAYERTMDVLQKLCSYKGEKNPDEPAGNITSWEVLFKSTVADLDVDNLCDLLLETITLAEKSLNHSASSVRALSSEIGAHLKQLSEFIGMILSFAESFLQDFLVMNKSVSLITHVLARVLASLYSKGFGISIKDQEEGSNTDTKDATGTGMGEGTGLNDVSDQLVDEDQLLGTMEKGGEEQDASNEPPNKDDKGIEMEDDFTAEALSVSEESGEDNDEDGEEEQLESAMGETGDSGEIVDEKLWNKEEDEKPENNEKYESGPTVVDKDTSSRELRAKEDTTTTTDEAGEETNPDKHDEQNDPLDKQDDDAGDTEDIDDVNMSKEEAFADPSGLKLDEVKENSEDMEVDEEEGMDLDEEPGTEEQKESDEDGEFEDEIENPADATTSGLENEEATQTPENEPLGEEHKDSEKNQLEGKKDKFDPQTSSLANNEMPGLESGSEQTRDFHALESSTVAPEANWSSNSDVNNLAPPRDLPSGNNAEADVMVADSSNGDSLTDNQPRSGSAQQESSFSQKNLPNPYRSVGDALEEWKERVKVSVDLQGDKTEGQVDDENADEYGYVTEFDKGTSQALGPATPDQMDTDLKGKEVAENDNLSELKDEVTEMDVEHFEPEKHSTGLSAPVLKNNVPQNIEMSDKLPEEGSPEMEVFKDVDLEILSESLVSVKKSYSSEDTLTLSKLSMNDYDNDDFVKARDLEEVPVDIKNNAAVLWRRYEMVTGKVSQELAEQLRLIMEPTLASKLQGDYRTGKRINMKKVIPYIASQYRKDKIWLRRTKPNKRDYQVVIAVDDSHSMSESGCGDVAMKALVTVCRAMSQLEMGNLAVASFGKKGNVRVLHDFDQSFTAEAGVKMISSLTFKQENTIEDEPVVDLLSSLNKMLDAAVTRSRLPSGQNPLQQLVLIIGDGRFHEKDRLKRCVRDFLSKKRMVAFLLLDNLEESIVDSKEVTMQGLEVKFSKYLDSFPFPYYILLRDIEALPRTLGDLLRQWFELMQSSRE